MPELRRRQLHKKVLATAMNDASSRGHTVFLLSITQKGRGDGRRCDGGAEEKLISSQLALVDVTVAMFEPRAHGRIEPRANSHWYLPLQLAGAHLTS